MIDDYEKELLAKVKRERERRIMESMASNDCYDRFSDMARRLALDYCRNDHPNDPRTEACNACFHRGWNVMMVESSPQLLGKIAEEGERRIEESMASGDYWDLSEPVVEGDAPE